MIFSATVWITLAVACMFALWYPQTAQAHSEGTAWMRDLRNGENTRCCDEHDCIPVASIAIVEIRERTIWLLINNATLVQLPHGFRVDVPCGTRPYLCMMRFIKRDDKEYRCAWENPDGSVGVLPDAECFRCALVPLYCSS